MSSKTRVVVLTIGLLASLSIHAQTHTGFSGQFAPAHWQTGSNAPVNLVNISEAPSSVKLSNYAPWSVSGVTIKYVTAPSNGTVTFVPTLNGSTPNCLSTYWHGQSLQIPLANGTPPSPISFHVNQGDSFGFAINGANVPGNFGCNGGGQSITLTISNFTFTPELSPFTSKIAFNGKCLDLDIASSNVQAWDCNGASNQSWTYDRSTGVIRSLASDKCLDASGYYGNAYLFPCHGGQNQRWDLLPSGQIRDRAHGQCLDLYAFNNTNGANVMMWQCNDASNQRWSSVSELGVLASGYSYKCLDVDAASLHVQASECHGGINQTWRYDHATAQIRSADFAGKCLYAPVDNQQIRMSACDDTTAQQWDFASLAIHNRGRNQCLDLFDFNTGNGAPVVPWVCNSHPNQRWYRL